MVLAPVAGRAEAHSRWRRDDRFRALRPWRRHAQLLRIHLAFRSALILGRMSLRALLMRLFLIVAIAANGSGIAGASMHDEHLHSSVGDARIAATQAAAGIAACHGTTTTDPEAVDHARSEKSDGSGEGSPRNDCCQTGDCRSCIHHCAAALSGPPVADFAVQYRQTADTFFSAHPSAVLANLFRPPIG